MAAVGRRSATRLVAALCAVTLACATLGSIAHRAVVEHVACEHGQLVELASSERELAVAPLGVSKAAAHEHHHCTLEPLRAPSVANDLPHGVRPAPSHRVQLASAAAAIARTPLVYAPKTSPPV